MMASWAKGKAEIESELANRRLERVTTSADTAATLLASARRHIESARTTSKSDPEGGYALAYDAARKAAAALLAHQGLRATSSGGHIAVIASVNAQFDAVPGLKSIDRLRRRRNQAEYPDPAAHDPVQPDEVSDAIDVAVKCVDSAERLIQSGGIGLF